MTSSRRQAFAQYVWLLAAVLVLVQVVGCGGDERGREFFSISERTSSDNTTTVFAAFSGAGQLLVYRIANSGGGANLLTEQTNDGNPGNDTAFHPFYRPDGSLIAFVSADDGNDDIFTMTQSGGSRTQITANAAGDSQPAFSPDGAKIAFVSNRGASNSNDIWMMDPDGTNLQQLTSLAGDEQWPTLGPGPGGAVDYRLAFQYANPAGSPTDVYTADVDVGAGLAANLTNITNTGGISEGGPSWDPTGTGAATDRLLYHSDQGGEFAVFLRSIDGVTIAPVQLVPSSFSQGYPVWYPDGTRFTFTQARELWNAAPNAADPDPKRVTTRFPS